MATGDKIQGLTDTIIYNLTEVGTSAEELQDYLVGEYDMDVEDAKTAIATVQEALENSTGIAKQMAETMQDNLNGQITILKSAISELAIAIGDILMPSIRAIVSKVQEFVDWLNSLDEKTKTTVVKIG